MWDIKFAWKSTQYVICNKYQICTAVNRSHSICCVIFKPLRIEHLVVVRTAPTFGVIPIAATPNVPLGTAFFSRWNMNRIFTTWSFSTVLKLRYSVWSCNLRNIHLKTGSCTRPVQTRIHTINIDFSRFLLDALFKYFHWKNQLSHLREYVPLSLNNCMFDKVICKWSLGNNSCK